MIYYYIIRKIALGNYTNYKKIKYIKTFNTLDAKIIYNLLMHTYFGNSKSIKNKFTGRITPFSLKNGTVKKSSNCTLEPNLFNGHVSI